MSRKLPHLFRADCEKTPFCPGCGHGVLMNAILHAVERLGLTPRNTLFVSGIGCAGWIPSPHFDFDTLHALHGRAIAFATGAKTANPSLTTIVISGDGDLLSIGGNHLIHAARRNTDITVICANNFVFGMTGGQCAPTTPQGATTMTREQTTSPPMDACNLVMAAGAGFAARYPVTRPVALGTAIEKAVRFKGFSYVEAVSPCPTQYGRRNGLTDIAALYEAIDNMCITQETLLALPEEARPFHIVVGERTS